MYEIGKIQLIGLAVVIVFLLGWIFYLEWRVARLEDRRK